MEQRFQVGIITSTHGLKGEVKVYPTTDDPMRFKKLKNVQVTLDDGRHKMDVVIESARFFKQFVILKFKGMDTIEAVERLRQMPIYVDRAHAVPLKENENFIADLLGVRVFDEDGSLLGVLEDVITTGANDVYQVRMENGKELLIPAIRDCILKVDVEAAEMIVHLLDGLLDLN